MHGDAAFAGQGIVAECFNMMGLDGYTVGGTLHVVVNNQLGFTTEPDRLLQWPLRNRHREDDRRPDLPCERGRSRKPSLGSLEARGRVPPGLPQRRGHRHVVLPARGHNEADEPKFTQPLMYERIQKHPPVAKLYRDQTLVADGVVEGVAIRRDADPVHEGHGRGPAKSQRRTPEDPRIEPFGSLWEGLTDEYDITSIETGIRPRDLRRDFRGHRTAPQRLLPSQDAQPRIRQPAKALRSRRGRSGPPARRMAFASLLLEGHPIRLTGQDVERGTFSHRHMVIHDQKTAERHMPINEIREGQAQVLRPQQPAD